MCDDAKQHEYNRLLEELTVLDDAHHESVDRYYAAHDTLVDQIRAVAPESRMNPNKARLEAARQRWSEWRDRNREQVDKLLDRFGLWAAFDDAVDFWGALYSLGQEEMEQKDELAQDAALAAEEKEVEEVVCKVIEMAVGDGERLTRLIVRVLGGLK